jgi:hypothetical protein
VLNKQNDMQVSRTLVEALLTALLAERHAQGRPHYL